MKKLLILLFLVSCGAPILEDAVLRYRTAGFDNLEDLRNASAYLYAQKGDVQKLREYYRRVKPAMLILAANTQVGVLEYRGSYARITGILPKFRPVWVARIAIKRY